MQGSFWLGEEVLAFRFLQLPIARLRYTVVAIWGCLFWYLASFYGQWESEADRILTSYVALQIVLSEVKSVHCLR